MGRNQETPQSDVIAFDPSVERNEDHRDLLLDSARKAGGLSIALYTELDDIFGHIDEARALITVLGHRDKSAPAGSDNEYTASKLITFSRTLDLPLPTGIIVPKDFDLEKHPVHLANSQTLFHRGKGLRRGLTDWLIELDIKEPSDS